MTGLLTDYNASDVRAENEKFLDIVKHGGREGQQKLASLLNDKIILKILREDGIFRRAIEVSPITNTELDFDPANPDIPVKYEPFEEPPTNYLVHSTDWLQPTRDLWYQSHFFRIAFHPLVSRKIRIDEAQLLASKWPIRQYLESVIRNDFMAIEDIQFVDHLERLLLVTGNIFGSTNSQLKVDDIMNLAKLFPRRRLSMAQILLHENTFLDILDWTQSEVGSIARNEIVVKGVMGENLKLRNYLGYRWLITNNHDVIPEKTLYALAPQKMLGAFYELQSPEAYVEYRDSVLSLHAREILGRGIINFYACAKVELAP